MTDIMQGAEDYLKTGNYMRGGSEFEGTFDSNFWRHYQTVTGKHVAEADQNGFFSCTC